MIKQVTVSAPGKLMLLGEHAVVFNRPCLVTAVNLRTEATVELLDSPEFQLEARDVGIVGYKKSMSQLGKGDIPKGARFVEIAIKNTLRHSGNPSADGASRISKVERDSGQARLAFALAKRARMTVGVRVVTKSELSPKLGFGSSSASVVCIVKALSEIFDLNLSKKQIFDLAYETVLDIQGKGSGFDVAASLFGGTLYFLTGGKVIEPMSVGSLPLIVGYTGIKGHTVTVINKVKESFTNRQDRLNAIYNGIENLVDQAKDALIKMDWQTLGKLMNKNQDLLVELGVSVEKLDKMIKASINAGAYGAKLSGAGGGDCMIALVSKDKEENVKKSIISVGGEIIEVKIGAEGVRME